MNKEITLEQLATYETAFDGDRANRIAMDAVTKNGVNNAAVRFENAREMRHTFNISLAVSYTHLTLPTTSRV